MSLLRRRPEPLVFVRYPDLWQSSLEPDSPGHESGIYVDGFRCWCGSGAWPATATTVPTGLGFWLWAGDPIQVKCGRDHTVVLELRADVPVPPRGDV